MKSLKIMLGFGILMIVVMFLFLYLAPVEDEITKRKIVEDNTKTSTKNKDSPVSSSSYKVINITKSTKNLTSKKTQEKIVEKDSQKNETDKKNEITQFLQSEKYPREYLLTLIQKGIAD